MKLLSIILALTSLQAFAFEEKAYLECTIEKGSPYSGQVFKIFAHSEADRSIKEDQVKLITPFSDIEFISKGLSNISGVWSKNFMPIAEYPGVYVALHFDKAPGDKKKFKADIIVAGIPNKLSSDDIFVTKTVCRKTK